MQNIDYGILKTKNRSFWCKSLGNEENKKITFCVGKYELELRLNGMHALYLRDEKEYYLSCNYQHYWIFHHEELEALCRYLALVHPELYHPGPALILLQPFALLAKGTNFAATVPMLKASWEHLENFTKREIECFLLDLCDKCEWKKNKKPESTNVFYDAFATAHDKWYLDVSHSSMGSQRTKFLLDMDFPATQIWEMHNIALKYIKTMRVGKNSQKIAQRFSATGDIKLAPILWQNLVKENYCQQANALGENPSLIQMCWITEVLLGLEQGQLVSKYCSIGDWEHKAPIDMSVSFDRDNEEQMQIFANMNIINTLIKILEDNCHASVVVWQYSNDLFPLGRPCSLDIRIYKQLDTAINIISSIFWQAKVPGTIKYQIPDLTLSRSEARIFSIFQEKQILKPSPPKEHFYFELANLDVEKEVYEKNVRINITRKPITKERKDTITAFLQTHNIHLDEDGWGDLICKDGGKAKVCFYGFETEKVEGRKFCSGSIDIEILTLELATLLHEILTISKLCLSPLNLVTVKTIAETLKQEKLQVVTTAGALYKILKETCH